jgi:glucokinase
MPYAIGIDLGGTNIKAVAVTEDGELLDRSSCETGDEGRDGWAAKVRQAVRTLEERRGAPADWVGLAAPGLAARDRRSIASISSRVRDLAGLDWTDYFGGERMIPVLNDAQAALLAESWRGVAVGRRHAIMLTLGTGVGGAILSDGKLMRGAVGRAGELGHVSLQTDGPPDANGTPGSLEYAIGNGTLPVRSNERFTSTRDLVEAHLRGDVEAGNVWMQSVFTLACAIASFINILDPEVVILGGGIIAAGPALFDPLESYMERVEWRPYGAGVPIIPAALGDFAGAMGAAYNAMRTNGNE